MKVCYEIHKEIIFFQQHVFGRQMNVETILCVTTVGLKIKRADLDIEIDVR